MITAPKLGSLLALLLTACSSPSGPNIPDSETPDVPGSASAAPVVPPAPEGPSSGPCTHQGSGKDYAVGPGKPYASIGDVPFESLRAGDTVRIFWRADPYREKMMIAGQGTKKDPIRVCGVPGPEGQLPVIDGKDATTRKALDFPFDGHQVRGLVIIGHQHDKPYELTPSHIVLEGLEIRNGSPPYTFTDRSGKKLEYSRIVAGIFVERAAFLTIRGCTVTANNNGIFIGTGGGVALSHDILLEGNHIYDNGSLFEYYEHNVYNEASNVVYQFNRFGAPRIGKDGVQGANIKERSAGVVIRYNWLEDGAHIIDLVDAQEAKDTTVAMPSFHTTHVYGNVIVRMNSNGSMIHYGGDSEVFADYRKGTLFFYNNTVIVKNDSYRDYTRTPIFELSTNDEKLDSRNNIYFTTKVADQIHTVGMLGARDERTSGIANFSGDWVKTGITPFDPTLGKVLDIRAKVSGLDAIKRADNPGFRDLAKDDFALTSPAVGAPVALTPAIAEGLLPMAQYVKHQKGKPRQGNAPFVGAPLD